MFTNCTPGKSCVLTPTFSNSHQGQLKSSTFKFVLRTEPHSVHDELVIHRPDFILVVCNHSNLCLGRHSHVEGTHSQENMAVRPGLHEILVLFHNRWYSSIFLLFAQVQNTINRDNYLMYMYTILNLSGVDKEEAMELLECRTKGDIVKWTTAQGTYGYV